MLLKRLAVIQPVIAEQAAEGIQPALLARHQPVPEIMPALVPEMAQQGAIGFAHLAAHLFAHGIVGLAHRECDQAIVMTGHHALGMAFGRVLQEIEGQAVCGIVDAVFQRQAQPQQGIEQPVLGRLQLDPELLVFGYRQVRNGAVVAAGGTKIFARLQRHHPVANPGLVVLAELVLHALGGQRDPTALRLDVQRRNLSNIRKIAQGPAAILAADIFEIQKLAAALAAEQFHRIFPRNP